jgi:hypothetical protein
MKLKCIYLTKHYIMTYTHKRDEKRKIDRKQAGEEKLDKSTFRKIAKENLLETSPPSQDHIVTYLFIMAQLPMNITPFL